MTPLAANCSDVMSCLDLRILSTFDSSTLVVITNFASHRTSMVAHVLTMDELAVRRAAAWLEYLSDHVPCSTRRQMFTGGANVTDQMARSHEMS